MANQQVIEKKPRSRVLDNVVTRFLRNYVVTLFLRNNVVTRFLRNTVRAYFALLAKLPTWGFIVAVAVWTVVFKTALVPIVALLNAGIFVPLGLDDLFSREPILELADFLTKSFYNVMLFKWNTLATISQVLIAGLLLPIVATFLAQVIPQHSMSKLVRSERHRAVTAAVVMGLIYMFCYGKAALFISGSVIAIPLVFTFFHRMKAASLSNAFVISAGIHGVANTSMVLFRGLLGGE